MAQQPRNIVTLSDIPLPLHNWLRHEKLLRTQAAGHRIPICDIVVEALEMYKAKIEADRGQLPAEAGVPIPGVTDQPLAMTGSGLPRREVTGG